MNRFHIMKTKSGSKNIEEYKTNPNKIKRNKIDLDRDI